MSEMGAISGREHLHQMVYHVPAGFQGLIMEALRIEAADYHELASAACSISTATARGLET
jgi:hypothetical protein